MECMELSQVGECIIPELKHDQKELDPEAEAIILYPSFGSPLLVKPGQPLQLYVLFERYLYEIYSEEKDHDPELTDTIKTINKSLKIFPFKNGKKNPPAKLFPSDGAAKANIKITYLKQMSNLSIEDKDKKLFGYLRKKTKDRYQFHSKGFSYLFLLEISNLSVVQSPGVFDCAWKLYDKKDPTLSMQPELPFPERQDLIMREYLLDGEKKNHFIKQNCGYKIDEDFGFTEDKELPLSNHHIIYVSAKDKLNIGQLTDIHVSSRQLALKSCEAQVLPGINESISPKIGKLINISYETFKNLLDLMGKDSSVDMLVLTGDMIDFNQNFDPTAIGGNWKTDFKRPSKLWEWMDPGKFDGESNNKYVYPYYIDMVTVYSLLHYFVKKHNKPIIMLTGNHEAYDEPYGISPRVGQFGGLKPAGIQRANEGIPADHNMTVYEATLLYGPKYNDYQKSWNFAARLLDWFYMLFTPFSDITVKFGNGSVKQSFTALEWQDEEQIIENFLRGGGTLPRSSRAITREQLSLLTESSRNREDGVDRILLTHFTFISYGYEHQITEPGRVNYSNEPMKKTGIDFDNYYLNKIANAPLRMGNALDKIASDYLHIGAVMSHYEEGSFLINRNKVYGMLYDGGFTHVLSGHTHRAGYYVMTKKANTIKDNVDVQGYLIDETPYSPTSKLQGGKARFIVGASAGPIPGQNHYDNHQKAGLFDKSLDWPSGNVLTLQGKDNLYLIKTKNQKAQPRFAVALSFFNTTDVAIEQKGKTKKKGVFQKFESGKKENEFSVELHPALPEIRFIDRFGIYDYQKQWTMYGMSVNETNTGLKATISENDMDDLSEKVLDQNKSLRIRFLRVTFNSSLTSKVGYKQYKYDSPWIVPIKIFSYREQMREQITAAQNYAGSDGTGTGLLFNNSSAEAARQQMYQQMIDSAKGYRIELGEDEADFMWYQKTFSKDYSTGKVPERTKDKDVNSVKMPD